MEFDVTRSCVLLGGSLMLLMWVGPVGCGDDGSGGGPVASSCEVGGTVLSSHHQVNGGVELDGCYQVRSSLKVSEGVLVLEPGTRLIFEEGTMLRIQNYEEDESGELDARGTEDEPVRLEGAGGEPGYWYGLMYYLGDKNQELRHVEIHHAGAGDFGPVDGDGTYGSTAAALLLMEGPSELHLQDVGIFDSATHGVNTRRGFGMPEITGCEGLEFDNIAGEDLNIRWGHGTICGQPED